MKDPVLNLMGQFRIKSAISFEPPPHALGFKFSRRATPAELQALRCRAAFRVGSFLQGHRQGVASSHQCFGVSVLWTPSAGKAPSMPGRRTLATWLGRVYGLRFRD